MSALARDPYVALGVFSGMNHSVPDSTTLFLAASRIRSIDLLLAESPH
jgi:hypothetical protein